MLTRIRRWGNSLALRIPRTATADLGWQDGSEVELATDGDRLVVRAAARPAPPLADLAAEISDYNLPAPAGTGATPSPPPPDRGDLVWLDGPADLGRMPYLIVSPLLYNARTGIALACPVAKRIKGYPFEVVLKVGGRTAGAVLADRVEAVAWRTRRAERADAAPAAVVREVAALLSTLLIATGGR